MTLVVNYSKNCVRKRKGIYWYIESSVRARSYLSSSKIWQCLPGDIIIGHLQFGEQNGAVLGTSAKMSKCKNKQMYKKVREKKLMTYLLSMTEMILCLLPIVPIMRRSSIDPSTDCRRMMIKRLNVVGISCLSFRGCVWGVWGCYGSG